MENRRDMIDPKPSMEQVILGEIRMIRSEFEDLSLQIRVDTPWRRFQDHLRYALNLLAEIPWYTRFCIVCGMLLLTVTQLFNMPSELKKKLSFASLDLIVIGIMGV